MMTRFMSFPVLRAVAVSGALALAPAALASVALAQTVDLGGSFRISRTGEAARVNVTLVRGITRSDQLPTRSLIRARKALAQRRVLSFGMLRALADHADGNAAFQLANRIDLAERPDLAADAAHYYGIAAATGRGGAIHGLVRALDQLDPETTTPGRIRNLRGVLLAYARAGSGTAIEAVVRYHTLGAPFGPLREELDELVIDTDSDGAAAVAMQLAAEILQSDDPSSEELLRARSYLERAQAPGSLRLTLMAGNLLPIVEARLAANPPQSQTEEVLQ